MKKQTITKFMIFLSVVCLTLLSFVSPIINKGSAVTPRQFDVSESIFLRNPSFSTFYNGKVYTLDAYDKFLKAFDISSSAFELEYMSLDEYEIVDAMYLGSKFFVLASKNSSSCILQIDIETKEMRTLTSTAIKSTHNKIFVDEAMVGGNETFIISLTNNTTAQDVSPLLICVNKDSFSVYFECVITFDTNQTNILNLKS